MTQRFDRTPNGRKLHMQSLGSMMHYNFNQPAAYSYEQAIQTCLRLDLPMNDREQMYRRAVFNVIARNQDDHVKNIAFLMNRKGTWRLSPAYDITYAWNPTGNWTGQHQMSINGKRDEFESADIVALAAVAGIKKRKALSIKKEIKDAVHQWPGHAKAANISIEQTTRIQATFRQLQ